MCLLPTTTKGIIVVRGFPGSGKTTLGKALTRFLKGAHIEQDIFFTRPNTWVYDHARRDEARTWELNEINVLLDMGDISWVVVTNNCPTKACVESYRTLTEQRKMNFLLFEVCGKFEPKHWHPDRGTIQRYLERWETHPEALMLPVAKSTHWEDQSALIEKYIAPRL